MNDRRISVAWPVTFAFLVMAALWLLGFPLPMYDDLFYSGAALNLAGGGDFSNPLMLRQAFPSHYFFVYPPLHSYVVMAWLKIFGISSVSLTAFQDLMSFGIAAGSIATLRKHRVQVWLEFLVPLAVTFAFVPLGLRPDPLAVALAMSGLALIEWSDRASFRLFAGFLLLFVGASGSPRVTFFAAAFFLCAIWRFWRDGLVSRAERRRIAALALGAMLVAVLVFLAMIGFRFGEFWYTFHYHSLRLTRGLYRFVVDTLGIFQWPLVLIPLALLIYALKRPKTPLTILGFFTAGAVTIMTIMGVIHLGGLWWFSWLMFVLAGSLAGQKARCIRICLPVAITLSLLAANRKLAVNCVGLLSGNIKRDLGEQAAAAAAMRPTTEHPLLIDCAVARYVFDYHLPVGAIDLQFGTPYPGSLPGDLNDSELRQGDIYLAGADIVSILAGVTYLDESPPKWFAFGMHAFKYEAYPRRVYIIPAEACKKHRPGKGTMLSVKKPGT